MMEPIYEKHKVSLSATEDFISGMPENVITNILDCLPIQNAVGTSILSRNWRFKWNMLTQLKFDAGFTKFLVGPEHRNSYDESIISRLLLNLKGPITKFVLYIPINKIFDVKDVSHWILFLSRQGIKEFTLINMNQTPLKLPTHLFSCVDLELLKLRNCVFHPVPSFHGFTHLWSLELNCVIFDGYTLGELITYCTLLMILRYDLRGEWEPISLCPLLKNLRDGLSSKVKLAEIVKLKNLRVLSFPLSKLDTGSITASTIFQLVGFFSKLRNLKLDFRTCKLAKTGTGKGVPTNFFCLKTLEINSIDFRNDVTLSFVLEMICGCPNVKTLRIMATDNYDVPTHVLSSSEAGDKTMGQLHLRIVSFTHFGGSNNEICLIKSLLASSPLLKKISIWFNSPLTAAGANIRFNLAKKLLKLHRASPIAEIDLF